jgi:hypothetical protein
MKKAIRLLILMVAVAACGPRTEEPQQAPPAAAVAPIAGVPLDTALALLYTELSAAHSGELNDMALARFERAEALTDRLLETRYSVRYLRAGSYSVEAKLRQIQALADRIVAQIGASAPKDSSLADLRLLMRDVTALREALKQGGGPPPTPIEKLLAGQRDTVPAPPVGTAPAEPDEGR